MQATVYVPGIPDEQLAAIEPIGDIVIGVNRAAALVECTHVIALDWPVARSVQPLGSPRRIISRTAIQFAQATEGVTPTPDGVIEDIFAAYPRKVPWSAHTLTAALVLAASLGATQIYVIGLDDDGPSDIEGHPLPELAENETRVRHDLIIFDQTVKYLEEKGVQVGIQAGSGQQAAGSDEDANGDTIVLPVADAGASDPAA